MHVITNAAFNFAAKSISFPMARDTIRYDMIRYECDDDGSVQLEPFSQFVVCVRETNQAQHSRGLRHVGSTVD